MATEIRMTIYEPPLEFLYGTHIDAIERLAKQSISKKTVYVLPPGESNFATSPSLPEEATVRIDISAHFWPDTPQAKAYIDSIGTYPWNLRPLITDRRIKKGTESRQKIVDEDHMFYPVLEANPANAETVLVRRTIARCVKEE